MMAVATFVSAMALPVGSTPPFIRGVNIGSTFVPENWMTPHFYAGTGATTRLPMPTYGFMRVQPSCDATERSERSSRHS